MNLGVIGEPCMDYIHRDIAAPRKQFGGILYSAVSLAVISAGTADLYPIMNLGEDEYDNVISFLEKFKNIKTGFINKSLHKTRIVKLYYKGKDKNSALNIPGAKSYDREESSTEPTLPVEFEQMKGCLTGLDGILINMVSGVDLTLETLKKIRQNFPGYIHMDLHNLVMQTFPDGRRVQMSLRDWFEWCSLTDTLQMNESEISVLTGGNATEYETARKILSACKVKSLVVTRGMQGTSLYEMKKKKSAGEENIEIDRTDVPSVTSPEFVDSTGCGDVFASGFFYQNARDNLCDFNKAVNFASAMAGLNASLNGVEDLYKLNDGI